MSDPSNPIERGDAAEPSVAEAASAEPSAADARRTRIVLVSMLVLYLVSICVLVALDQIGVIWKSLVVPALAITALLLGRFKVFVRDWAVFLGAVVLFDACRGVVYGIVTHFQLPVYMGYAIKAERAIFGEPLLTVRVQSALTPDGHVGLFDKLLAVIYGSHFLVFLFYGLTLWLFHQQAFGRFKASMLLVMYGGLIGYLLVPTVPPWMAAHQYFVIGDIQELGAQLFHGTLPNLSAAFELDPVAAMPSLHCAFPTLLTLITFEHFGWIGLAMGGYSLLVFLSTVHLGHHYGVDVLGGVALALLAYLAVYRSDRVAGWLGALPKQAASAMQSATSLRVRVLLTALLLALTHASSYLATALVGGPSPLPTEDFIARELDGKSPMANYYRGLRAYQAQKYALAQTLLGKALREVPSDEARDSALGTLALSAYFNHDYPTVVAAASKLNAVPSGLALIVAESLVRTGKPEAGFHLLDAVAADHPDHPDVQRAIARLAQYRHGG
jgi:membrane-associated phospholipid phosphatase